jgi:hypothetical protein
MAAGNATTSLDTPVNAPMLPTMTDGLLAASAPPALLALGGFGADDEMMGENIEKAFTFKRHEVKQHAL